MSEKSTVPFCYLTSQFNRPVSWNSAVDTAVRTGEITMISDLHLKRCMEHCTEIFIEDNRVMFI